MLAAAIFAVTFILILAPLVYVFYGAFRTAAPGTPGASFTVAKWITVYTSPDYLIVCWNTLLLGIAVSLLSLAVGGTLAWIIARTNAYWRNQLALLIIVPLMISNLVTALAWIALAAPHAGFINFWAREVFGIPSLVNIYSFWGIVWVLVLHYASFAFLSLYAALRSIDASLEEASYMLGGGPLRTGLRMTLPLVMPTLATGFVIIFVFVAENFSVPTLLGTPVGFETLPSRIYTEMAVTPTDPTLGAAAGTMLLWIALAGTLWQRRMLSRASRYVTIGGKGGRHRLTDLGGARWLGTAFVIGFLFLAVGLPYLVLVLGSFLSFLTPHLRSSLFTFDNYRRLFQGNDFLPVQNSLILSALGGLGITFAYVLISYLLSQYRGRFGRILDTILIVPTAIPALVLGVGMVWAFVGLPLPIYGTMTILIIAYFIRYIGYGVRHANTALIQVSSELPEAARVLGASPLRSFRDVLIPIIRPSILSLWTVLFIFIFMELSVTILLYSPTSRTLPVVLWNYMASGFQTRAFAVAVFQATLIFVVLFVANRKFGTLRTTLEG